jgi:hypothetical protein
MFAPGPSYIILDECDGQDMISPRTSLEKTRMATIHQDIESFHQFASEFVRRGEGDVTIDDLYENGGQIDSATMTSGPSKRP